MELKLIKNKIPKELYNILEKEITKLRPAQEKAIKKGLLDRKNLLVCTPTASGKTLIAELAAFKSIIEGNGKAIYIVPLKALASEKYKDFKRRYGNIAKVALSMGDIDSADSYLVDYDIIITTSEKLDSLIRLVRQDSLAFDEMARIYSEDVDSRINGGQMVNPARGGAKWRMDEFQQTEYEIISALKIGEISEPYESTDDNGKTVYKVIWLKNRTDPHLANLKNDYNVFKEGALIAKENEMVNTWIEIKL